MVNQILKKVRQFMEITHSTKLEARRFLKRNNDDLSCAIDDFFLEVRLGLRESPKTLSSYL